MESMSISNDYIKELDEKVKKKVDKKRYQHTIGVAYTAAAMAMAHNEECSRAYIAGLLHDNAKCIPVDKKLSLCKKYKLAISDAEKSNPELLHAKLGAVLAKDKFGIEDEEIISAIACHTTGKPGMTVLEKILYIADYIEPGRKMLKDMDQIRKYAFSDLDMALQLILENTLYYLEQKKAVMDPLTKETYEFYHK